MAGLKEIKRRLTSVRNTKKITYAMKLVSAAKLRKAQDFCQRSRNYTQALTELLESAVLQLDNQDMPPLASEHLQIKKVVVLVVGASRGLCGSYNSSINKRIEQLYKKIKHDHTLAEIDAVLIGKKPAEYFKRLKRRYSKSYENIGDDVFKWPTDQICSELEERYINQEVDKVYLVYTKFTSALSMSVEIEQLLPVEKPVVQEVGDAQAGYILFEPSPKGVFAAMLPKLTRARLVQAGLDAKASEHGSRMTAMDSATKNSGEIIQTLQLTYNKLRQAQITAQILDIVGGSEAVN
jgi:F-type H+-transporting ATPase subunit gamma